MNDSMSVNGSSNSRLSKPNTWVAAICELEE